MHRVAAIQMASGPNVVANLRETARLLQEAAQMGAQLVILPENFACMAMNQADLIDIAEIDGQGVLQDFLAAQAMRHHLWLVGGTFPMRINASDRVRSVCLCFDNHGVRVARYDKIHLFDVTAAPDEKYCESDIYQAGTQVVVLDTPFGRLGLAICYDLRFPELFRSLQEQGAEIIAVPSAFTATTGKAHWEILVRARALENLSYLIAADQGGYHVNGRQTHGDSIIVEPWGGVLARLTRGTGVICADIDLEHLHSLRRNFPTLSHRKIHCQLSE
jgi:nitrilase